MIQTETYEINGTQFVRTYSDAGRYVVRDGISYEEANDPASLNRQYTEGDIIVEGESPEPMVATDNIPSDTFFECNGKLYQSTQSIVIGEAFVPGVNCIETTVADELNSMKGEE